MNCPWWDLPCAKRSKKPNMTKDEDFRFCLICMLKDIAWGLPEK